RRGGRTDCCLSKTRRDALSQLGGRLTAEREDEDLPWRYPVMRDPVDHRLDQRGRLARPRPGQNEERATAMIHDRLLVWVELRCCARPLVTADKRVCASGHCRPPPPQQPDSTLWSAAIRPRESASSRAFFQRQDNAAGRRRAACRTLW